jgi:dTDP-4-amino-4,6-dideoxygalactose transaminase
MTAAAELAEALRLLVDKQGCSLHGRASHGLKLLLEALTPRFPEKIVAMPSLVCHSAAAAVVAAGWTPLYCDVDPRSAQVPDDEWRRAAAAGARVFLLVHLYGNRAPTTALEELDGFVIEDACQALGVEGIGKLGAVTLFSFGHTKLLDVGHGGAVLTRDPALATQLQNAAERDREQAADADASRRDFYARKDRFVSTGDRTALAGLVEGEIPFIATKFDEGYARRILELLPTVPDRARRRREKWQAYVRALERTVVEPLALTADAVPWRFVFTLPDATRASQESTSVGLRRAGVDVSNWYLPCHWLTRSRWSATGDLRETERFADRVFQLWLDDETTLARIEETTRAVRRELGQ